MRFKVTVRPEITMEVQSGPEHNDVVARVCRKIHREFDNPTGYRQVLAIEIVRIEEISSEYL